MEHALDCRTGGLDIQRHNEIRDVLVDLASIVYKEVIQEPVGREADDNNNVPLSSHCRPRSLWLLATPLFNIRVVDTDAKSYVQCNVGAVLFGRTHGEEKKEICGRS